jgi:hypothetical protein
MTTSLTERQHRAFARVACAAIGAALVACSDEPSVIEPPVLDTRCAGVTTPVRSPNVLEPVVLTGTDVTCFVLAGEGREYLVIPQLTGATLPYGGYGFRLGDSAGVVARITDTRGDEVPPWLQTLTGEAGGSNALDGAAARLHARLRQEEQAWRPSGPVSRARVSASVRGAPSAAADTLRTFSVLNTLAETPAFSSVAARLRFEGQRVLLYVDTLANAAYTASELTGMGTLYDTRLAPAVTSAFGDGSDIDGNGRLIFLLTPTVNAMVSASQCATSGFVRGFFYNQDLRSTAATSNRAEIFYAYVPDSAGRWSCPHAKAEVMANLPPTFMHELQHMLSFGEHALERGGTAEEIWLNEGLSHMAEELGSLSYETRFPAPSGRTNPTSIFPDSSTPFINPNLLYSYRYLFSSAIYSVTSCAPGTFCSLAERGGTWLFLRWMADQQGSAVFRRLVETNLTGRANLEAVLGRSTASALADYAMAVSADSIVGSPRSATPAQLRFTSRNLRRLYRSLFEAFGIAGGVGRPFPIEPLALSPGSQVTGTMRPGTFLTYRLRIPAGTPSASLRLLAVDGTPFPATSGAQVAILRMP